MGEENWGLLASPRMHAILCKGLWAASVRRALESGPLVPLSTHDPDAWAMVQPSGEAALGAYSRGRLSASTTA